MDGMTWAEEETKQGKQKYLQLILLLGLQQNNSLCNIKSENRLVTPTDPILNYL